MADMGFVEDGQYVIRIALGELLSLVFLAIYIRNLIAFLNQTKPPE